MMDGCCWCDEERLKIAVSSETSPGGSAELGGTGGPSSLAPGPTLPIQILHNHFDFFSPFSFSLFLFFCFNNHPLNQVQLPFTHIDNDF